MQTQRYDFRLGVDLGGTKIEIAALAADDMPQLRHRVPTPSGYDATVRAIAELVRDTVVALWNTNWKRSFTLIR